jgi:starch synthase
MTVNVAMVASEAHPYARTGGLGDVLGALPIALRREGVAATVCLPGYPSALAHAGRVGPSEIVHAPIGSRTEPVEFVRLLDRPFDVVLACADRYFRRDFLYGPPGGQYPDNAERFIVFCRAVLEWLRQQDPRPDILHAHDWQAALAIAFLRANASYPELARTRTVFTIHNLAYQGRFWSADWHLLNLDLHYFSAPFLEFYGEINFLKAGLVFADALTTVSPRYAAEIQTPAFGEGLDGVLRSRATDLRGIVNGIDFALWNPQRDPHLPAPYSAADLVGKARCKAALQAELGLPTQSEVPLVAMITRLADQKGADLAFAALPALLADKAIQFVLLGNGDDALEQQARLLVAQYPGRAAVRIGFDEPLAHRIEAGADLFLMPSRFEPCGLNQLYSLRYGTIPVVHSVGGLDDTVQQFDAATRTGNGFKFTPFTPDALTAALRTALSQWHHPAQRTALIRNGMLADFSWDRSAAAYRALYDQLLS